MLHDHRKSQQVQDEQSPPLDPSPATPTFVAAASAAPVVAPCAAAVPQKPQATMPTAGMGSEVPKGSEPPTAVGMVQTTVPTAAAAAKELETEKPAVEPQTKKPDALQAEADAFASALEVKMENMNSFPAVGVAQALVGPNYVFNLVNLPQILIPASIKPFENMFSKQLRHHQNSFVTMSKNPLHF